MRKTIYRNHNLLFRYYRKFINLRGRIDGLIRTGEFYRLSREIRSRMVRKLKLLYERLVRMAGKQKLRWAGAAMAMILSASVAKAQFNEPVDLSGFHSEPLPSTEFVDFDEDGDLDIVVGEYFGSVYYVQNDDGKFSKGSNPFSAIDVTFYANPALGDLDDDGDLDLVVGNWYGYLFYYENESGDFTEQTGTDNPFNGIDVGDGAHPVLMDVDGDDDLDLVCGYYGTTILYFENDGGVFTELTGVDNPFSVVSTSSMSILSPYFADYDGDTDPDLFVSEYYGSILYYSNEEGTYVEQTGANNPFEGVDYGDNPIVSIVDPDDDGDLDLIIGNSHFDYIRYFRNDAGTYTEKRGTPNPFEGILGDHGIAPAISDMDNDGDLDILIAEKYGLMTIYENTDDGFVPVLEDFTFDTLGFNYPKPVFADIDEDMDDDLIIGGEDGMIRYYSKEGPNDYIELTGPDNPFNGIDVGDYSSPAFADIDGDGDLDCFIGYLDYNTGQIAYFRNEATGFNERTGTDNPFYDLNTVDSLSGALSPVFADIDRDEDIDLFIGGSGAIHMYTNNEGTFAIDSLNNPFLDVLLGFTHSPSFGDIDEDGDLDLYVGAGTKYGTGDAQLFFLENTQGPDIDAVVPPTSEDAISIYVYDKTVVVDAGIQTLERISVYSLSGVLVKNIDVNQTGRYEFGIENAGPGIYMIQVFSKDGPVTGKVVIR